jgi:hypothetical protein
LNELKFTVPFASHPHSRMAVATSAAHSSSPAPSGLAPNLASASATTPPEMRPFPSGSYREKQSRASQKRCSYRSTRS